MVVARVLAPDSKLATARGLGEESALLGARRRALAGGGFGGLALPRAGLAAGAAAGDRVEARREAPARGHAPALRRDLHLPGGAALPAGGARLQPRRQAGEDAAGLRPADHARGVPGGGRGLRRQHGRPGDARLGGREGARALRAAARGLGGRPRAADQRAHRGRAAPRRRLRLDHRAARARRPGAGRRRGAAALALRPARPGRDPLQRLSRRAADRLPQPAAGRRSAPASARRCSRPPRRSWRRSRRPPPASAARCAGRTQIGVRVGARAGPLQDGQALPPTRSPTPPSASSATRSAIDDEARARRHLRHPHHRARRRR